MARGEGVANGLDQVFTWFMRYLAWILVGIGVLTLVASIPLSFGFWEVYGPPDTFTEWWSQSWWLLAVAAVPTIAGYLVLRIAIDRQQYRKSGER